MDNSTTTSATAPLLLSSHYSSSETETETPTKLPPQKQPPPPPLLASPEETAGVDDIDEEEEWSGILQALVVSMAWFFDAQQTFITVFTDADPTGLSSSSSSSSTTNTNSCSGGSSSSSSINLSTNWDWPTAPTGTSDIVSEWGLECASSLLRGLPASAFFMGCLVGGALLASLADSSLGRKRMLLLSCWVMSISALLTAFSPNLWAYSALRFLSGFGRASIGSCALVLATELVGKRWRARVGIIGFFCFTLGFLSLPALAYANRGSSWRVLYLWTALPGILYCVLVHAAVRESPRWLRLRNLRSTKNSIDEMYEAMRILVRKGWAARRVGAVMGVGFGVGFVYYGMPLGLKGLAFKNLYLSVAFNALSELPASIVTLALVSHLDRKPSLLVFTTVSGACSVVSAVSSLQVVQIGAEMVSFFSACTAFNVLLIYTVELFPTCVRNSAVSMVRQALVLGGVFSPVLVAAGAHNGLLSFGVFGLVIGLCGLFAICLPETRGKPICDDTMEEENSTRPIYCV